MPATRRAFLGSVTAATASALAGCGAPDRDATSWTQFGAGAANTATAPDARGPPVRSTPVVSGGRVYLGTTEGVIYCLA